MCVRARDRERERETEREREREGKKTHCCNGPTTLGPRPHQKFLPTTHMESTAKRLATGSCWCTAAIGVVCSYQRDREADSDRETQRDTERA